MKVTLPHCCSLVKLSLFSLSASHALLCPLGPHNTNQLLIINLSQTLFSFKIHAINLSWSFELVETCLMKVVVDMGSYGVRWGHRGWFKIRVDSGADEVHRGSYGVEFKTFR